MHGWVHPNVIDSLVVDLRSSLAYFMMTHPPAINLPIKTLVARQLPTNYTHTHTHTHTYTCHYCILSAIYINLYSIYWRAQELCTYKSTETTNLSICQSLHILFVKKTPSVCSLQEVVGTTVTVDLLIKIWWTYRQQKLSIKTVPDSAHESSTFFVAPHPKSSLASYGIVQEGTKWGLLDYSPVPPSCSLTFQYKFSHFSVFCMLFQHFSVFYK